MDGRSSNDRGYAVCALAGRGDDLMSKFTERHWSRQHSNGVIALVTQRTPNEFWAYAVPANQSDSVMVRRTQLDASNAADAAAGRFFDDAPHECSGECGLWCEWDRREDAAGDRPNDPGDPED
jgi:hypothetical protein